MRNIILLIACAALFAQCNRPNLEVYPTGTFDTLGVQFMTIERNNMIYYFQGTGKNAASIYTDMHEEAYAELNGFFQATLPSKLRFFVWTDWVLAQKALNHYPGFAQPVKCICHVRADQTLGHEITHILGFWAWGQPAVRTSKFINEGLAVAFDLSGRDKMAIAKDALKGTSISSIMEIWKNDESISDDILYPVGGAFMDFLYKKNQTDKFKALIKKQTIEDAEEIYGKAELEALVAEFNGLMLL